MNSILKIVTNFLLIILFVFISIHHCSSVESEKSYCQKQAKNAFLLCLINVTASPGYFGKEEWNSQEIQTYSQGFCIAEYNRKLKCPGKQPYKPHRKD